MNKLKRWQSCEHGLPKDQCDLCRPAPPMPTNAELVIVCDRCLDDMKQFGNIQPENARQYRKIRAALTH